MAKGSNDPSTQGGKRQRKATEKNPDADFMDETASERESTFMRILDSMPVLIMETDREFRITYMNARFTETSEYHLGEILPLDASTPHPFWRKPDSGEPFLWNELPAARVCATNAAVEDIMIMRTLPTGDGISLLAKAQPIRNAAGVIIRVIVVLVDITAQREAEHRAQEHAAILDAVIDSMRDAAVVYDLEGKPTRFNPAALALMGWSTSGIDPLTLTNAERAEIYDVLSADGSPLPREQWPLRRALRGEVMPPAEISLRRLDGQRVILIASAMPLRDPRTGDYSGAVGFFQDMTDLYQLERMREEFINIASHELRTPLTSMGLANHLLQQWLSRLPNAAMMLDLNATIATQMKRMERLINNMLDLTAITGGNFHVTRRPADLAKAVRAAVDEQRSLTKREFRLTGADEAMPATIDTQRINQVITNLLVNAQAHSSPGTPIDVRLSKILKDGMANAQVSVRDYGKGIPADQLEAIFERFGTAPMNREVDDADSSVNGLRFGLFLARTVINEHGGTIGVESQPGRGSTFTFEIPISPQQEQSS